MAEVTRCQELYLELMRLSSFNEFDGERVVGDLLAHRDLWQSCLMTRSEPGLILRDLAEDPPEGSNNVDTLYLLAEPEREWPLEALAGTWDAEEVGWVREGPRFLGGARAGVGVLMAWWD